MAAKGERWAETLDSAPFHWQRVPLGQVFSERIEQNRPDLQLLSVTADDGVVPRDSLARRDTSNPDKAKYLRICPGDLVYNTMRMWQGVSALVRDEGIVSPAYTVCVPSDALDVDYAGYLLKYPSLVRVFHSRSQGLVDDTLSLRFGEFVKVRVPLPPLREQRQIAAILGSVDEAIQATQAVIEQTRTVKQGLLRELLSRGIGHTRFKQTEIGEVPEGWGVVTVQDVISDIDSGWSPECDAHAPSASEWGILKTTAVVWDGYDESACKRLPGHLSPREALEVCPGDVLITRAGPADRVGVVVHVDATRPHLMLSDKIIRLQAKADRIDSRFLAIVLAAPSAQAYLVGRKTGLAASQTNISQETLKRAPIPLPPIREQQAIIEALDSISAAGRREAHTLVVHEAIRRGLMQDLLTGRVRVGGG